MQNDHDEHLATWSLGPVNGCMKRSLLRVASQQDPGYIAPVMGLAVGQQPLPRHLLPRIHEHGHQLRSVHPTDLPRQVALSTADVAGGPRISMLVELGLVARERIDLSTSQSGVTTVTCRVRAGHARARVPARPGGAPPRCDRVGRWPPRVTTDGQPPVLRRYRLPPAVRSHRAGRQSPPGE